MSNPKGLIRLCWDVNMAAHAEGVFSDFHHLPSRFQQRAVSLAQVFAAE